MVVGCNLCIGGVKGKIIARFFKFLEGVHVFVFF